MPCQLRMATPAAFEPAVLWCLSTGRALLDLVALLCAMVQLLVVMVNFTLLKNSFFA